MDKIYFLILASHITVFFCGCVFSLLIEKYNNKNEKRTLNEYRQTKDSDYSHPYSSTDGSINLLCRIYPNDAELGKIIRKHFQKL